jgi:tetratricopeptide (TPR) repeat protein
VADDLASVGAIEPFAVMTLFVAGGEPLRAWAAGATLQVDDRPSLEFSGPRNIFGASRDDNAAALRALAASAPQPPAIADAITTAGPENWRARGTMLLLAEAYRPAYDDFARTLERDPNDELALDGLIRAATPAARLQDARSLLTRLASEPGRTATKLALSRLLASEGAAEEAARIPLSLLAADPRDVPALEQLASILSDTGDAERLAPVVARLAAEAPSRAWTHYYAGSLFFLQNRFDLALREARMAATIDPAHAKAHNLVGACLASMGQAADARRAFETSLRADPREPGTYTNLATLELQLGNPTRARQYFAEALTIDPDSAVARQGLASLSGR